MGRFGSVLCSVLILLLASLLSGCGHSQSVVTNQPQPVPATLALSPNPTASLEQGHILTFTGTALDTASTTITETITYQSSNPSILTVSTTGLACAGSWDSLTSPQVCTPGPAGTAQVTATAEGVSSPPTTVYVHQHIDNVQITPVAGQLPPTDSCVSTASPILQIPAQSFNYQATAFSRGLDITSTVGPISWQAVNSNVVTLAASTTTKPITGLQPGQVQATANIPGLTQIYASVGGTSSLPFDFMTCPVQSITLTINDLPVSQIVIARSSTQTVVAKVIDTRNVPISGNFLTWCSSQPAAVSTSLANCGSTAGTGLTVTVSGSQSGGGAAITAACSPPACNVGILPSEPIYPQAALQVAVASGSSTSSSSSDTVWATSTGCGATDGCTSAIVPITTTFGSSTTAASTIGNTLFLPATPNSLVFNQQGTRAYIGTESTGLLTKGLVVLDPTATTQSGISEYPIAGKVLAVSPDGASVVISDTAGTPNQVDIFSCTGSGGACGSTSIFTLNVTGATAAAFSPDGLKVYIVAGSNLYVFSKLDAVQTIALAAPATDVAFLPNGMFGYMAGGDPAGVSFLPICSDASSTVGSVSVPTAGFLRALPDGKTMLTVVPPNIQTFTVAISGTATPGASGCPAPRGFLNVTNTPNPPINLGRGNFVAKQLLISSDGSKAYVITGDLGNVLVFDIQSGITSAIALHGNALAVNASLNVDGSKLYVAASDGMIHVLDTLTGVDAEQISIPNDVSQLQGGLCVNVNFVCNPDLIAVRP